MNPHKSLSEKTRLKREAKWLRQEIRKLEALQRQRGQVADLREKLQNVYHATHGIDGQADSTYCR